MTVASYRPTIFKKCKKIYHFLSSCQQQASRDQQVKLANISLPMADIEPWQALAHFDTPAHFYYGSTQQTFVGIGSAISQQASGSNRFDRIQQFIDVWKRRVLSAREIGPLVSPYFLCRFTFFDQVSKSDPFSPAQVFVPQLQLTSRQGCTTASFNYLVDDTSHITSIVDDIGQQLQELEYAARAGQPSIHTLPSRVTKDVGNFREMVANVLPMLNGSRLRKVVLAEALDVLAARPFNVPASLRNLEKIYGGCYVFSISDEPGTVFLGASPERLLSISSNSHSRRLITDALAGSAPRGENAQTDSRIGKQLFQSSKERYEHQIVVNFIVKQLAHLSIQSNFSSVPQLLKLANIQHLHTPIRATLPQHIEPLQIVKQLHPTPAVAGLPRTSASQILQTAEMFERSLYAAPLGWIDASGNSEFVVGIRSALVRDRQARLFAGAGIVAQSAPDRELNEVQLKLQALLGALV